MPNPQSNFTCRVDTNLKEAFLKAAKANDRSASVLIRDFMRSYIQHADQMHGIKLPAGLSSASAHETPHDRLVKHD